MSAILTEFLKLHRSLAWAVVVLLPIVLVLSGSAMTLLSGEPLVDGWHTLWMRSMVFPGLFPLGVGIAILAALLWRPEHRGGTWNALMTGTTSSAGIVLAKAGALIALVAGMQLVALITVVLVGTLGFGLPGVLPPRYLAASAAIVAAGFPVAALQSGLSMLLRSFALPVGLAVLGCGISAVLLQLGVDAVVVLSPYGALTRATQLGTGVFADTGTVWGPGLGLVVGGSVVMTGIVAILSTRLLDRRDVTT